MYQAIAAFLSTHPVVRGVLWGVIIAVATYLSLAYWNWVTWKRTPDEWAVYRAENPKLATLIVWSRIIGPHLRQIPQVRAFIPPFPPEDPKEPTP